MAQLTTLEFVSGAFRVCKFQSGLLAKYFILANNCRWSHTNFGQTGGDLSFRVPYLFQIHWPHGVFHQKMRSRNLQFLCSLWQLGFFLNVNFSSFKTPPAPAFCCKVLRSFNSALVPLEQRNFKKCWCVYWSRSFFLWMVQRKSRFLNLKRGDGTTQEFVSGAFRVCKFQSGLLAKYFILANNCRWSHTNFGQTGGDLSFRVPYLFQRHWPHGVFHQKMRSRNLQFLCSLWQLGFFLNVNFSSFKTPPALHSVAKCFAAST